MEKEQYEKLEITASIDDYSEKELSIRGVATLQLFKADTLDLVFSVIKNNNIQINRANVEAEILAFAVFNCWHISLSAFKDEEKANVFNNAMTVVFKHEYSIESDEIFKKYYEPVPKNGAFNEFVWPFWIFGKAIVADNKSDVEGLMKIVSISIHFLSSINRSLNITLNLKDWQLMDFMAEVEKNKEQT